MGNKELNIRIAKNTLLLYLRMLFAMFVSLYTSRIVLKSLGVEDFGIYNVVGGVVIMLAFLNHAMSASTQRFLTFELGKEDFGRLEKVFRTSLSIHLTIGLIVFFLGETIGIWLIYNFLNIPDYRVDAAFWVLQFSVFSFISTIFSVPFTASIIANEKMKTFAIIGILEVFLKLGAVLILLVIPNDKLISYSILLFLVTLAVSISSVLYSRNNFLECRKIAFYWDKKLFNDMSQFAGWNLVGVSAGIAYNQGVNILLNVFFGPVVNAARGIAFQVQTALNSFVSNFQVAINPSITKEYAKNDLKSSFNLVFMASKFSFFLLLLLSMPIILETDSVLFWWLKIVPEHTVSFTRLVIFDILIGSISGSIQSLIQANGKIKVYQMVISGVLLLNLPISYIFIKQGFKPEYTFYVSIFLSGVALFFRLWIVNVLIKFPSFEFFKSTLLRIILVSALSFVAVKELYSFFTEFNFSFLILCSLSIICVLTFIFLLGLNNQEKDFVLQKVKLVINKNQ